MKFPLRSVLASFTCLAPSRSSDTSAPAKGLPLLSRTDPVIVASALGEAAGVLNAASIATTNNDRLNAKVLLIRKDLQTKTGRDDEDLGRLSFLTGLMRAQASPTKGLSSRFNQAATAAETKAWFRRGDLPEPPE